MNHRLAILIQHIAPKLLITRMAGRLASCNKTWVSQRFIRWFIKKYNVNMQEARQPEPEAYANFNAFFTRELRQGARPLATADWVCPVDGMVSQIGPLNNGELIQAKGRTYSAAALLADAEKAAAFKNGHFATLYLSPRDYHRIHMPCDGKLLSMHHVPGDLYSVNPTTAEGVEGLFARNERLVCWFEGPFGPFSMVLVGATIVGSIGTVWSGIVTPPRRKSVQSWDYQSAAEPIVLRQGDEMGRFQLGSTVVMVFPEGPLHFNPTWQHGTPIQMGQVMAQTAVDGANSTAI